jgi:hypothetical protein
MGTPSIPVVGVNSYASVRWSAIFAGWIVATGVATLMYVAGLAFGFSVFDPYNAAPSAKGVGIGTAIWIVLTWIVSSFLGGMFASWFDGNADQTVGTLHGVGVWGLAVTATVLFVTLSATHVSQSGAAAGAAGATDAAAHYAAMAMWVVFLSILLALIAAAAGGWLGAGHIHRVYHMRRYETGSRTA